MTFQKKKNIGRSCWFFESCWASLESNWKVYQSSYFFDRHQEKESQTMKADCWLLVKVLTYLSQKQM